MTGATVPGGHGRVAAITGGTGFIGSHLVRRLAASGWQVNALARRPEALPRHENIQPVRGALNDPEILSKLVSKADAVIHCAGLVLGRSRKQIDDANIAGTRNLVNAVKSAGQAGRFVFISSLAARAPEISWYGASKRAAETLLSDLPTDIETSILRPPAVYGPGDQGTLILFRLFARGLAFRFAPAGRFSMIYVDDVISGMEQLLNAGPETRIPLTDLDDGHQGGYGWDEIIAEARIQLYRRIVAISPPRALLTAFAATSMTVARLSGKPPTLTTDKVKEITHVDWVARDHHLRDVLQWQPETQLSDGFGKTLNWYRNNGWI
jgi:nucleoside-diphosphate-sugar epimerase